MRLDSRPFKEYYISLGSNLNKSISGSRHNGYDVQHVCKIAIHHALHAENRWKIERRFVIKTNTTTGDIQIHNTMNK